MKNISPYSFNKTRDREKNVSVGIFNKCYQLENMYGICKIIFFHAYFLESERENHFSCGLERQFKFKFVNYKTVGYSKRCINKNSNILFFEMLLIWGNTMTRHNAVLNQFIRSIFMLYSYSPSGAYL